MDVKYKIQLHSFWHCGSGLSKGAMTDAIVIKDKDSIPFIPGKTIKGLLREATEDIICLSGIDKEKEFVEMFGTIEQRSSTFFSNAVLPEPEISWIKANDASAYLYKNIANTAIGTDGIALEHSLRGLEVVVPCTLYGSITGIPEGLMDLLPQVFAMVKNLGTNRNHGLGRCTIEMMND